MQLIDKTALDWYPNELESTFRICSNFMDSYYT